MRPDGARRLRICFLCTHSFTLATLYKGLFPYLTAQGFDVEVVTGDREYSTFSEEDFGQFKLHIIPMRRTPAPLPDLVSLARLTAFFATRRFDVIHVSTPKASLLGALAARITGAGPVVFVYRRKIYELYSGMRRKVFTAVDRLICTLSAVVIPISRQIGRDLLEDRLCPAEKIRFIGNGSSNGINVQRFSPTAETLEAGRRYRAELNLPEGAPVLAFLGRVCREKGVDHLPGVVERVRKACPTAHMVVVGPDDERDPISEAARRYFETESHVRRVGYLERPEKLFALCDVFVFPSLFEGFGNVLLEAAAMGRPSVAFDVPGVNEAVAHERSGFLSPVGDEAGMADHVVSLLMDDELRARIGRQAQERVDLEFRREVVWEQIQRVLREVAAARTSRA